MAGSRRNNCFRLGLCFITATTIIVLSQCIRVWIESKYTLIAAVYEHRLTSGFSLNAHGLTDDKTVIKEAKLAAAVALDSGMDSALRNIADRKAPVVAMPSPGNENAATVGEEAAQSPPSPASEVPQTPAATSESQKPKMILLWHFSAQEAFGHPNIFEFDPWPQNCGADINCAVSTDRKHAAEADAILFSWKFVLQSNVRDLPDWRMRNPRQRFVFFSAESPAYYPVDPQMSQGFLSSFFNWTMTYRLDSDIPYPYGVINPRPLASVANWNELVQLKSAQKSKFAAVFMTDCSSTNNRLQVVRQLGQYIPLDSYGGCGSGLKCPIEEHGGPSCREMLERDYLFYLAFENSLCRDYVTEKIFLQLDVFVVPVVLSRNITLAVGIPGDSFIAADDFKDLKQLAEYLQYLANNRTAYAKYFEWKQSYETKSIMVSSYDAPVCPLCDLMRNKLESIKRMHELSQFWKVFSYIFDWNRGYNQRQMERIDFSTAFCPLCAALHNQSMPPKTYADMHQWWNTDSHCVRTPPFLNLAVGGYTPPPPQAVLHYGPSPGPHVLGFPPPKPHYAIPF